MGSCTSKNAIDVGPVEAKDEDTEAKELEENARADLDNSFAQHGELSKGQIKNKVEDTENNNTRINSDGVSAQQWRNSSDDSSTSKNSREDERNVPELTNNSSVFQASLHQDSFVPRPVAFDVLLDENKSNNFNSPRRLKKLENAPRLTAEQLEMKMNAAEEKRQRLLERKAKKGSVSSRRRKELVKARELDWIQQQNQQQHEKSSAAERKKAKLQSEIVSKQRKHDAKVRRVRARARQLHDEEFGDADFDVDHDERYNADSEGEAWSEDENIIQVVQAVHSEPHQTTQESSSPLDENFFTS